MRVDGDAPVMELARLLTSGGPLQAFFDSFAGLMRESFDGARLFVATNDPSGGWLVRAYGPEVELSDPYEEARLTQALTSGAAVVDHDAAFFPLVIGEAAVGAVAIYRDASAPFASGEVERITDFLHYLALRVERETLKGRIAALESLALVDGLTGVLNRASFDERLNLEWNRALRSGERLSLIMVDIDLFKAFNDRYGHVGGDFCLRTVALALREGIGRASDAFARYGGEEFAAILPATETSGAIEVAEKMRAAASALSIPHDGSSLGRVSISVGVATMHAKPDVPPRALIEAADKALYEAKAAGRNRVVGDHYASDAEPVFARRERSNNIPAPLTRFFGRVSELIALRGLFEESRLITLTGAGGVGKTRLAIAHAASVAAEFEDGVWFVDLAEVSAGEDLLRALARVLHVRESGVDPLVQSITERLAPARSLLIFDNCEHLIEPAAHVIEDLVLGAPRCRVLVTSREPLGVDGERVFRVPPLDAAQAVELFSDRAIAAGAPAFRDETRRLAQQVCERLDGIPMALELAAARLRNLTIVDLARRLDDRFAMLAEGRRTALPRQKTLGALIDWSYTSLDEDERAVLDRLGVFAGSISISAACAVCAPRPAEMVTNLLQRLFDKSLIERVGGFEPARYRLLETIRASVRERLQAAGQSFGLARLHASYFAELARSIDQARGSVSTQAWREAMRPERENFVQAMRWALEVGHDPQIGGTLAASLSWLWIEAGEEVEGLRWIDTALDPRNRIPPRGIDDPTRALLHMVRSRLLLILGRHHDSQVSAERALALFTELGDEYGIARARAFIGGVLCETGDLVRSREWLSTARDAFITGGHDRDLAGVYVALAIAAFAESDYAGARDFQMQALEIGRRISDDFFVAVSLGNLGEINFWLGDRESAMRYTEEALDAFTTIGAKTYLARTLVNLATFTIEDVPARAAAALQDALAHFREQPNSIFFANCLDLVARYGSGDAHAAAQMYGYAETVHQSVERAIDPEVKQRRERDKAGLATVLGEAAWKRASAAGAALTRTQALDLAVRLLSK